jgi:hypothetical protein
MCKSKQVEQKVKLLKTKETKKEERLNWVGISKKSSKQLKAQTKSVFNIPTQNVLNIIAIILVEQFNS